MRKKPDSDGRNGNLPYRKCNGRNQGYMARKPEIGELISSVGRHHHHYGRFARNQDCHWCETSVWRYIWRTILPEILRIFSWEREVLSYNGMWGWTDSTGFTFTARFFTGAVWNLMLNEGVEEHCQIRRVLLCAVDLLRRQKERIWLNNSWTTIERRHAWIANSAFGRNGATLFEAMGRANEQRGRQHLTNTIIPILRMGTVYLEVPCFKRISLKCTETYLKPY